MLRNNKVGRMKKKGGKPILQRDAFNMVDNKLVQVVLIGDHQNIEGILKACDPYHVWLITKEDPTRPLLLPKHSVKYVKPLLNEEQSLELLVEVLGKDCLKKLIDLAKEKFGGL